MRTAALETRAPGGWSDRWRQAAEAGLGRVATASKEIPRPRPAAMLDALRRDDAPSSWRLLALSVAAAATLSALAALVWVDAASRLGRTAQGIAAAGFLLYAASLCLS
jgi:hypothetical protein